MHMTFHQCPPPQRGGEDKPAHMWPMEAQACAGCMPLTLMSLIKWAHGRRDGKTGNMAGGCAREEGWEMRWMGQDKPQDWWVECWDMGKEWRAGPF